jgi:hypothetical protein
MTELNQANICEFCKRIFSSKSNCTKHKHICKIKKIIDDQQKETTIILKQKEDEIKEKDYQLRQKEDQIKFLKSMLESYTNKPTNISYNNCNNVNNNLTIKQMVSKLDPINFKDVRDHIDNFTSSYQDQGTQGFAKFLCDHPFKDKFITTDFSRSIIAYKTNDHEFVRDPESSYLINRTIKENKSDIIESSNIRLNFVNNKIMKSEEEEDIEKYCSKKMNIKNLIDTAQNVDITKINDKDMSNVFRNSGVVTYQNILEEKELIDNRNLH